MPEAPAPPQPDQQVAVLEPQESELLRNNPAIEWEPVEAIGFKGLLPTKNILEKAREAIAGPSKNRKHMLDEAEATRIRASRDHKVYKDYQNEYEVSRTDTLTGLKNRRAFEEDLEASFANDAAVPGVVFIDIDGFKAINDIEGHGKGDDVLKAVAEILQKIIRKGDRVYRIGGDEFVILAARAKDENKQRNTIEMDDEQRLEGVEGRVVDDEGLRNLIHFGVKDAAISAGSEQKIGASSGHVVHRVGESITEFLTRADREMYDMKNARKNNIGGTIEKFYDTQKGKIVAEDIKASRRPSGEERIEYKGNEYVVGSTDKFTDVFYKALIKKEEDGTGYIEASDIEQLVPPGLSEELINSLAGDINLGVSKIEQLYPDLANRLRFIMETKQQLAKEFTESRALMNADPAKTERASRNLKEWTDNHHDELCLIGDVIYYVTIYNSTQNEFFHQTFDDNPS